MKGSKFFNDILMAWKVEKGKGGFFSIQKRRMRISWNVTKLVVATMLRGPPNRTSLIGETTNGRDKQTSKVAALEGSVCRIAVKADTHAHSNLDNGEYKSRQQDERGILERQCQGHGDHVRWNHNDAIKRPHANNRRSSKRNSQEGHIELEVLLLNIPRHGNNRPGNGENHAHHVDVHAATAPPGSAVVRAAVDGSCGGSLFGILLIGARILACRAVLGRIHSLHDDIFASSFSHGACADAYRSFEFCASLGCIFVNGEDIPTLDEKDEYR